MFTDWLITVVIGFLVFILISYYQFMRDRKRYPPGPRPIPLLGNMLSLSGKEGPTTIIGSYYEKYGDVFTLWMGNKPHIVVSDWKMVQEILARSDLNHRPPTLMTQIAYKDKYDVVLGNPSPKWRLLKKTLASALRKYLASKRLESLAQDIMEGSVQDNLGKETIDGPKFALNYVLQVMAEATFGSRKKQCADDTLSECAKIFHDETVNGFLSDYLPLLRSFLRSKEKRLMRAVTLSHGYARKEYRAHRSSFNQESIRDLMDGILASTQKCIKEENDIIDEDFTTYMILDLLFAGTNTTANSLSWTLLYLAKYPEFQKQITEEVKEKIGDRMATREDINRCHYTMAFFYELFRLKAIVPFLVPHYTQRNTRIGNHNIPAGSAFLFNTIAIQQNSSYWEESTQFKPERFLDKYGILTPNRPNYYCPFGLGLRACVGEKFAKANLFLGVVALLQRCQIVLASSYTDDILIPDPKAIMAMPKTFKINFIKRD